MMPVLVLRPQPGCDATVAAAHALGLDARGFPLSQVTARAWQPPRPGEIDALLVGSANAIRHAGPTLAAYAGKPAYAVGERTAEAARDAGLRTVATGSGGLQTLLGMLAPIHRTLLRLAGDAPIRLTPPAGISIVERIVYASRHLPMPQALVALLAMPALVLLHSAETARHFADECTRLRIGRTGVGVAAIGPRVADAAGEGWRMLASAERPDDGALLALASRMCNNFK